jgi:hypothetical protein
MSKLAILKDLKSKSDSLCNLNSLSIHILNRQGENGWTWYTNEAYDLKSNDKMKSLIDKFVSKLGEALEEETQKAKKTFEEADK